MFVILFFLPVCLGADPLELLNIDHGSISVSGISSGGCMATQWHVAYSASVMGVGVIAGAPYACATTATTNACMNRPDVLSVSAMRAQAESYAAEGIIDVTSSISGDRVWVFGGSSDTVVHPDTSDHVADFYSSYTSNIFLEKSLNTEHTFPTVNKGNACLFKGSPYIGQCNYDGAYEMLNYFYGNLVRPDRGSSTPLPGTFRLFDQREFFYISLPGQSSMDTDGYVYIPSACQDGSTVCKLHVALHGCEQGRHAIADVYARDTGYNEVGELNNIVILYPQATSGTVPLNPYGCWDWWGYTINDYATKRANQILAIARMVDKIAGTSLDP